MNRILPTTLLFLLFLAVGCKKQEEAPSESFNDFGENNGWTTTITTDVQYGMASSQGKLFRTYQHHVDPSRFAVLSDDGTSWSSWSLLHPIMGLLFTDPMTGFCPDIDLSFKTLDGGHTWNQLSINPEHFVAVPGTARMFGFGGGEPTHISDDQGATWTDAGNSGPGDHLADLDFTGSDTGYALVSSGGILRRSTDGGMSWENVLDLDGSLTNVSHHNGLNGVALFNTSPFLTSDFLHTTDGWNTYSTTEVTAVSHPNFLWSDSNGTLYAGQGLYLYRSTDNGQTWTVDLRTPLNNALIGIVRCGDELWVWYTNGFAHKTVPV